MTKWEVKFDRYRGSGRPFTGITVEITANNKKEAIKTGSMVTGIGETFLVYAKRKREDNKNI